ncbi:MAG: outer membrane protein [Parvibaculaceae bacterium]
MKKLLLAMALTLLPAGAVADEPAAFDWSGAYAGAHLGYGEADVDYDFAAIDEGFFNEGEGTRVSERLDDLIGGVQAGLNWQSGNIVLGLEGAFTWLGFDERSTSPFFPESDGFRTGIDWSAAITPRAGIAFDNVLLYAKGGVAFADVTGRIQDNLNELFVEKTKTQVGWTIGAGADYALSENWIIGAEGNYYDFGSFDAGENTRTFEGVETPSLSDHEIDTTMWSVLARISFMFR